MIACYLHHGKQSRHSTSGKITTTVAQHHTRYRRGYVGKRDKFPYMSRSYQYHEIRRETVCYSSD